MNNNNDNSNNNLTTVVNKYGSFTFLSNEEGIGGVLKSGVPWEENIVETIKQFASLDKTFIDIGAHIGCISLPLAESFERVISFEPQKVIFDLLNHNIQSNNIRNVTTFNLAVGHTHTKTHMSAKAVDGSSSGKLIDYKNKNQLTNFGGIQLGMDGEDIEMVTLDRALLPHLSPDSVSVMKVDVEGCEPLVFYGAQDLIRSHRPVIFYENNYKRITRDIRDELKLPLEIEKFSIESYTWSLGYQKRFTLVEDNDYILMPHFSIDDILKQRFKSGGGVASFHQESMDSYMILKESGRSGVYPVYRVGENEVWVHFTDEGKKGKIYKAYFNEGKLNWDNGTFWTMIN